LGSVSSEDRGEHVAEMFLEFRATGRGVDLDAGRPEEIAETIVFVASDKTSYIMGASIAAGGGKWAR
jgi:NAD(P)-dependent dehydrogenase (short-subunit alcohol dehydrogenase family)